MSSKLTSEIKSRGRFRYFSRARRSQDKLLSRGVAQLLVLVRERKPERFHCKNLGERLRGNRPDYSSGRKLVNWPRCVLPGSDGTQRSLGLLSRDVHGGECWADEPRCAPSVAGEKFRTGAFPGGFRGLANIPMGPPARVSGDCAAGADSLGGASPVVRGLQVRVGFRGAWQADPTGGCVHALVNDGRESSALLAGVSTRWSARPLCRLIK